MPGAARSGGIRELLREDPLAQLLGRGEGDAETAERVVGVHQEFDAGAGTALHRTSILEFAPLPTAIPCARLHTVHILHEWGMRDLADDAALIVSELMTNAAEASTQLPGRPPIALRLLASERSLVIEVWDQSPLDLEPHEAGDDDECGRGLTVVAALSERWGWERTSHHRKVVWAVCALEAPDCIPGSAGRNSEVIPGSMAYPASKDKGDRSMPLKRRPGPGIRDGAPRDPRNMVKAELPEP